MAYAAPVVTAAGLSVPSYADIRGSLTASYQTIFGQTTYLGNDAADYQWISAVALKLSDNCSLCQLDYNNRAPLTAIGAALDSLVKLNGLARKTASFSSVILTLTGTAFATITNGIVADANGIYWLLPSTVTIGVAGTVSVSAICQQAGPVSANAYTITTPVGGFTGGWTSVTNPSAAVVGTPIETDSQLRARQSLSVALPSLTRLAGTIAGIAAVPGVSLYNVVENQTNVTDSYGNTGHSITAVVQGGTDLAVATAIYDNRGIGPNTQAATVPTMTIVPVTDETSGNITDIGFVRPVGVPIFVGISIHGLTGVAPTSAVTASIITALVAYLNNLQIGEEVTQSALYGAALSVIPNLAQPIFSIRGLTLGTAASALFTATPGASIGTGYIVGDVLVPTEAGGSGGSFSVTSVDGSGGITGLSAQPVAVGTGYHVANNLPTTGGTGLGAQMNITAVAPITTTDIALLFYQLASATTATVALAVI
jgi:uncharacterized phage protein gp47/JayE